MVRGFGIMATSPKEKQDAACGKYVLFATNPGANRDLGAVHGYMLPVPQVPAISGPSMTDFYSKKPNYQTAGKQLRDFQRTWPGRWTRVFAAGPASRSS